MSKSKYLICREDNFYSVVDIIRLYKECSGLSKEGSIYFTSASVSTQTCESSSGLNNSCIWCLIQPWGWLTCLNKNVSKHKILKNKLPSWLFLNPDNLYSYFLYYYSIFLSHSKTRMMNFWSPIFIIVFFPSTVFLLHYYGFKKKKKYKQYYHESILEKK